MAVVNSEDEAKVLRYVYFKYGPARIQLGSWDEIAEELPDGTPDEPSEETPDVLPPETTPTPGPIDVTLHIGFHDMFIEGEYLTVRSK
jgi:hypothetical protein